MLSYCALPQQPQESQELVRTAKDYATETQQTLSNGRRTGGPQKGLQPQRRGRDAEKISADQVRPDGDGFIPARGRSETIRPNGPRHLRAAAWQRQNCARAGIRRRRSRESSERSRRRTYRVYGPDKKGPGGISGF